MGVGPIPRSAILAYADEFDIHGDRRDVFCNIIRAMDAEYLSLMNSSTGSKDKTFNAVSADDAEGVKNVFGRLEQRGSAKRKPRLKH